MHAIKTINFDFDIISFYKKFGHGLVFSAERQLHCLYFENIYRLKS